ncbi:type II secretion system F family protein [Idiomarina seosinensis]|uniref:type II secretion system F family protein n=1 Tax=Idiomarina seosinensis TaxID=281739 RepID=UPI00384DB65D
MARFQFKGFDESGGKRSGDVEAEDIQLAVTQLEKDGLLVTSIKPRKSAGFGFSNGPTLADIEYFTSELSVLLESGLRVDKGLGILLKHMDNERLKPVIKQITARLKSGVQLSEALAEHPNVFDELYTSLVRVGEESGDLGGVFKRLANELKERKELRAVIQQALVYPAVILVVCIVSVLFVFNFVVPNLTNLFSDMQTLPWYTSALLGVSDWVQQYQIYVGLALAIIIVAATRYKHHATIKRISQYLRERLPLVKTLSLLSERARFSSALAVMLESGVAVDRAIGLAKNTISQQTLWQQVNSASEKLKRGESISGTLGSTALFSGYYRSLIVVGEESGEISRVFAEIADRSRGELNAWVKRLTTLLEPLLILTMGAIVGTVVVVMMLSINSITDVSL